MSYQSEFTQFMREMKQKNPVWAEQQRAGRAMLWDKRVDFEELKRFSEASVSRRACNYDLQRGE